MRCHGYLTVPAQREEELKQRFKVDAWDRPSDELSTPISKRQPLRAILKDLVVKDVPLTEAIVKKTLKDLRRIRRLRVYPMDIAARNYKGGLLIDFSIAITEPHYLFAIKPRWRVQRWKHQDLDLWQIMVAEEEIATWERAIPNKEYCKKLRSHDDKSKSSRR